MQSYSLYYKSKFDYITSLTNQIKNKYAILQPKLNNIITNVDNLKNKYLTLINTFDNLKIITINKPITLNITKNIINKILKKIFLIKLVLKYFL